MKDNPRPFKVDGFGEVTLEQLAQLTDDEMLSLRGHVEASITAIKGQLDKARAERHVTGQFADADWFARAKGAQRIMGLLHQHIGAENIRRKARRREAAVGENKTWERAFVEAARSLLMPVEFNRLVEEANRKST